MTIFSPSFVTYQSALALTSATDRAKKAPLVVMKDASEDVVMTRAASGGSKAGAGGAPAVSIGAALPSRQAMGIKRSEQLLVIRSVPPDRVMARSNSTS